MIKSLMKRTLPKIPHDIKAAIDNGDITLTAFEDKNEILKSTSLREQVGFSRFEDGSYLVSMVCPMPGVSADMISWWFWWHAQKSERYRVWYPGEHFSVSYLPKDKAYFKAKTQPEFLPNTHLPIERIGKIVMPLRIDFITAGKFGFDEKLMKDNNIPLIVCGEVSAVGGLVKHTQMCHIFREKEDGLILTSCFWLGKTLKNPLLRKIILTDDTAKGMAEHCAVEYRALGEILPALYDEYAVKM